MASCSHVGGRSGYLSVEGDTAMYPYCEVQRAVQKGQAVRPATSLPHHKLITTCCSVTHIHRHIITILQSMLNVNMTDMEKCWVKLRGVLDWEILHAKNKR
jgi:hypothetical protein